MNVNKPKYTFKQIQFLTNATNRNSLTVIGLTIKFGISKELARLLIDERLHKPHQFSGDVKAVIQECIDLGATMLELKKLNFPRKELQAMSSAISNKDIPKDLIEEGEITMDKEKIDKVISETTGIQSQTNFKVKDFIDSIDGGNKRVSKNDAVIISTVLTDVLERRISLEQLKNFLTM